jgi:hypothetical protein
MRFRAWGYVLGQETEAQVTLDCGASWDNSRGISDMLKR